MKHLAAFLLLRLGGNEQPSAGDIEKLLSSVGIEADSERLQKLVGELEGKDINELIAEGQTKLASVPSGGGSGGGGAAAAGGAAEEKKEEKAPERECFRLSFQLSAVLTMNSRGGVRRGHGLRSLRLSAAANRQASGSSAGSGELGYGHGLLRGGSYLLRRARRAAQGQGHLYGLRDMVTNCRALTAVG